jgi:hypothetical protein
MKAIPSWWVTTSSKLSDLLRVLQGSPEAKFSMEPNFLRRLHTHPWLTVSDQGFLDKWITGDVDQVHARRELISSAYYQCIGIILSTTLTMNYENHV